MWNEEGSRKSYSDGTKNDTVLVLRERKRILAHVVHTSDKPDDAVRFDISQENVD